ncbi:flagellar basal-body MS-ring/collar protein FliF [Ketobacter alkanivorans]|uniref:Flagellar M-ring protein n=1 Tax=Ketobacter alkanivorans TaxID=1917421 RepID=A0A2K9LL04_9GAMM|nr:flagellar basal-body MS-ring/collar protein FliF [Ketobacter alkanivorans]AUM12962.1 flagellar M-ring protein FliF [Ketobacter alkanivorans]
MFLSEKWGALSGIGKAAFIVACFSALLLPLIGFYGFYSSDMAPIYQGLSEEDASKVVTNLSENKIEYQLKNGGRDIYVASDKLDAARLQLAGDGVRLGSGIGFEIFDEMEYGVSEFAQKINYQRALQGELSRTIASLDGIKYARVHLVLPEERLFEKKDRAPKASVNLMLEEDALVSATRIQGIQRIVANSVEGLSPERVIVSDNDGEVLSVLTEDGSFQVSATNQRKESLERALTRKCSDLMEKMFGYDRTVVNVDVSLTGAEIKRRTESVVGADDGLSGVLVSKRISTSNNRQNSKKTTAEAMDSSSQTEEMSYRTGTKIEEAVVSAGQIAKLSVSAVVPVSVTDRQLEDLSDLLKTTVGFDSERGDSIAVRRMAFVDINATNEKIVKSVAEPKNANDVGLVRKSSAPIDALGNYSVLIGVGGVLVGFVLFLLSFFVRRPRSLSDSEREILLENIQSWIASDEAAIEGERIR